MSEQQQRDIQWMREAIRAARGGQRIAPPNPAVGCVLVKDGKELARGFTQRPGGRHAEIDAIETARANAVDLRGATAYVTLEPCSHYGRTPPCALRLIDEGISRVVVGTLDPNPLVAGRGCELLHQAGLDVVVGVCEKEAIESNIGFLTRMRTGKPWIRLKVAAGLDGRTALLNGVSQWITSAEARRDGHVQRSFAQGILTGIGTVLADDPQMNVRLDEDCPQPVKFIVDTMARTPVSAKILRGAPCTIYVSAAAPKDRVAALEAVGAEVKAVPSDTEGRLDLQAVIRDIGSREINVLHVEAGSGLNGGLLQADLVDELIYYVAPLLMGEGRGAAQLPRFEQMDQILRWNFHCVDRIGPDVRLVLRKHARSGAND